MSNNIVSSPGRRVVEAFILVLILSLLSAIVWEAGHYSSSAQLIAALSIMASVGHAVVGLGWREAAAYVGICLCVTFSFENIGVATGFPFGSYQFELNELPRIGAIPIIVGPLYVGMGYLAWVVASLILSGHCERPVTLGAAAAKALVASFVMTQWDVVMDPGGSTLARAWTWHQGGGYFGVPITNFLGWLLITATFSLMFSLFQYSRRSDPPPRECPREFWMIAVLLYLASGLSQIAPFLLDQNRALIDPAGRLWQSRDLRETAVIVMMMTMLPSSVIATLRLYRSK